MHPGIILNLLQIFADGGTTATKGQPFMDLLFPLVMVFVIFYLLLIRPQQKKMKSHKEFLDSLKKGDEVVTDGGIMGRITGLTEKFATLELCENVRIKIMKDHIASLRPEEKAEK